MFGMLPCGWGVLVAYAFVGVLILGVGFLGIGFVGTVLMPV